MGNVSAIAIFKFRWVDDISNFNVMDVALNSPTGYILEIDLKYPQLLYDMHVDLPFCPMHDKPSVNGKTSFSPRYTIRNVTLYIIEIYSNVLVMVFG